MKDSFVIHKSIYTALRILDNESMWKLMHIVFQYELDGVEPELEGWEIKMARMFIKNQLDRSKKKREEVVNKRKEAWKLGWLTKVANVANASFAKQNVANGSKVKQSVAKCSKAKQMVANGSKAKQSVANVANANFAKHKYSIDKYSIDKSRKEKSSIDKSSTTCDAPQTPVGLTWEWFTEIALGMKSDLLVIRPKCTESQFMKTIAKCWEYCTRDGKTIVNPEKTLRTRFTKQLDFMSWYEAWLVAPQNEEQRVKEYKELWGVKFTERYGEEQARVVRDRKFNKEMFGVYILNNNNDDRKD